MNILSIVTPTYNSAQYLEETIISVVGQAGDFIIQYHIQDGGSTDGTLEIIKKWEKILASPSPWLHCREVRFSWKSEPDNGMYDAINKGFHSLHIPDDGIMAWINSDDIYFQYAFATADKAFQDVPELLWFGGVTDLYLPAKTLLIPIDYQAPYPTDVIKAGCCDDSHWRVLQQNGMFWKKSLWDTAGGLNAALRYAGDFALWIRFAEYAPFVHFPFHVGTFRVREGQLSQHNGYNEEMEDTCPREQRKASMNNFLQQWGPLHAPVLKMGHAGSFFIAEEKVYPPAFQRAIHTFHIPRLSMAIRLWLPQLHRLMNTLRIKTRRWRKNKRS